MKTATTPPAIDERALLVAIDELDRMAAAAALDTFREVRQKRAGEAAKVASEYVPKVTKLLEAVRRAEEKERGEYLGRLPETVRKGGTAEDLKKLKVEVSAESSRLRAELAKLEGDRDALLASMESEAVNAAGDAAMLTLRGFEEERTKLVSSFSAAHASAVPRRAEEYGKGALERAKNRADLVAQEANVLLAIAQRQVATGFVTFNLARRAREIESELRRHEISSPSLRDFSGFSRPEVYEGAPYTSFSYRNEMQAMLPEGSEWVYNAGELTPEVPIFRIP